MHDNTPMKCRKLRIAWSVFFAIATVLLIVLWVRSYLSIDTYFYNVGRSYEMCIQMKQGRAICTTKWPASLTGGHWTRTTSQPDDWHDMTPYKTVFGFALVPLSNSRFAYTAIVPLWFFVLGTCLLSGMSWIRIRLSPRFSLGTLLIATTLVAVVLGLAAYALRK